VKSSSHSAPSARARRPELLKLIHRRIDDTSLHRWQALTGGTARHAISARSFDDLAAEVGAADV
jgi:hypothetical protein